MISVLKFIVRLHKDQDGQGMVEYLLIIGLVVLGLVTASTTLSGKIANAMGVVGNRITNSIT